MECNCDQIMNRGLVVVSIPTWTLTGKNDGDSNEGDETIVVDIDSGTNATEDGTQEASLTLTYSVQ